MDIHGIGPAGAARTLADVGDVARFPNRAHFASWTGTAPIDASSGQHTHHWLSRAGNRRLNHVLYMAGIVQLRNDTPGRAYYRRRVAEGKTPMEAMRCLRRRLSDVVYRQLASDALAQQAGPGGHSGATLLSSAADLPPVIGTSTSHFPDPHPRRSHRQPQLISEWHQRVGRDRRQLGEVHHAQTLRLPPFAAKPTKRTRRGKRVRSVRVM
jgi:transposase